MCEIEKEPTKSNTKLDVKLSGTTLDLDKTASFIFLRDVLGYILWV